ncbi:hypothetical protein BRADI_3g10640v3 [Brachypodium distachyon]|uniref:Calcineurin B-like protein n=1 Tax=Brachypodium distachyon TaxID=15368 RepID=A0A2K2CWF8_BRADI|nr:hypothetical protein BRADI_3g10640v3 [Brachypodium distachyon]
MIFLSCIMPNAEMHRCDVSLLSCAREGIGASQLLPLPRLLSVLAFDFSATKIYGLLPSSSMPIVSSRLPPKAWSYAWKIYSLHTPSLFLGRSLVVEESIRCCFPVLLAKSGLFTTRKGLSCKVVFMGCASSKQFKRAPHHEDASILAKETTFSVNEVEALYVLFEKISYSIFKDGLIHKEEFQLALFKNSNRKNLFADRIFDLFDLKRNGVIEFGEFVRSLHIFHPDTPMEDKIACELHSDYMTSEAPAALREKS